MYGIAVENCDDQGLLFGFRVWLEARVTNSL
jgi:hypothetical protein